MFEFSFTGCNDRGLALRPIHGHRAGELGGGNRRPSLAAGTGGVRLGDDGGGTTTSIDGTSVI